MPQHGPPGDPHGEAEQPSIGSRFLSGLFGDEEITQTRRGPVSARRGGIPGKLASLAGGTANLPLVGPILSNDAPPINEATALHEGFGHDGGGKGAFYDLKDKLTGGGTPEGLPGQYFAPSEVFAYSTQPDELSQDEILNVYGPAIKANPKVAEFLVKHRNPDSDWPASVEEWQARLAEGRR